MSAPCLVNDQRLTPGVAHGGDAFDVARPVRSGAHDQRSGRIRMPRPRGLDIFGRRRMSQVQTRVIPRFDPPRLHSGEDEPGHYRLVRISGNQQLTLPSGDREHRRLDRQRAAAGREEGLLGTDRFSHQLLRISQVAV